MGKEVAWIMSQRKVAMVNRMKMMSLGRLSLRSKCRKGVGLHLYSTQMRRETNKGVKIVDWCQDFGSRRNFVCQSSAQVPVHLM
jgi:hypothetical protein